MLKLVNNFVRDNALLYKVWFNLVRKKNSNNTLPNKRDLFYFGGYARSGNTYFSRLIKFHYPEVQFSHHLHTLGAIKLSLLNGVKTMIIFRKPEDAIASFYFTKNSNSKTGSKNTLDRELLSDLTDEYVNYYGFVLRHSDKIKLICFEAAIKNPTLFLSNVIDFFDLEKLAEDTDPIEAYEDHMRSLEKNKTVAYSSLPNAHRKEAKLRLKGEIDKMPSYEKAKEIYQLLLEKKYLPESTEN